MKRPLFIVSAFVVIALSYNSVLAQQSEYFEVPLKYVSFSLLNHESCPLQLSDQRVIASKKGYLDFLYEISNEGHASVKSMEIQEFDAFVNPSYAASPRGQAEDELAFPPYATIYSAAHQDLKANQLDKEQIAAFGLSESRKRIWIVLVTKVELYDGTKYDATSKFNKIRQFIEDLDTEEFNREDQGLPFTPFEKKLARLKAFIDSDSINQGVSLTR